MKTKNTNNSKNTNQSTKTSLMENVVEQFFIYVTVFKTTRIQYYTTRVHNQGKHSQMLLNEKTRVQK